MIEIHCGKAGNKNSNILAKSYASPAFLEDGAGTFAG